MCRSNVTKFLVHHAKPHAHTGVMSMTLEDALTNHTICHVSRANGGLYYGRSASVRDETDYLVVRHAWG